jgi:hypothetical protein
MFYFKIFQNCFASTITLSKRLAIVRGPTPQGTGVMCFTLSFTDSKSISPAGLPSLCQYQISIKIWFPLLFICFSLIRSITQVPQKRYSAFLHPSSSSSGVDEMSKH